MADDNLSLEGKASLARLRAEVQKNKSLLPPEHNAKCPICNIDFYNGYLIRYPEIVCQDCLDQTTDENGRDVQFFNQSMSGGLVSYYRDSNEKEEYKNLIKIKSAINAI